MRREEEDELGKRNEIDWEENDCKGREDGNRTEERERRR